MHATVEKRKRDSIKEINTPKVVTTQTARPRKQPNKLPLKNPNRGNNKIKININLSFLKFNAKIKNREFALKYHRNFYLNVKLKIVSIEYK